MSIAMAAPSIDFGERIRRLREDMSLSQRELAEALSIHQSRISQLESSPSLPDGWAQLRAVCEALDVSSDYLIGLSDHPVREAPTGAIVIVARTDQRRRLLEDWAEILSEAPDGVLRLLLLTVHALVSMRSQS